MKKRLLSAALALVMVLTMLPLSALPAFAAPDEGTSVTYYAKEKVAIDTAGNLNTDAGWYYDTGEKVTGKSTKVYAEVTDGMIGTSGATSTSGKYYKTTTEALDKSASYIKVIENNLSFALDSVKTTSLTIDTFGNKTVIVTGNLIQGQATGDSPANTKLTTLTLTSTGKDTNNKTVRGNVTWSSVTINNQSFTLNVTDITKVTGDIELTHTKDVSGNLTVNVTRSEVEDITLDNYTTGSPIGTKANKLTVKVVSDEATASSPVPSTVGDIAAYNASVSVTATSGKSELGAITSQVDSSTVSANQRTGGSVDLAGRTEVTDDVTLCGTSTLKMNGMSKIDGDVYLYGGKKGDNTSSPTSTPSWKSTVTVDGTSTITGAIQQPASSGDENGHSITIKGGSEVGSIDMSVGGKSTITIADSKLATSGTTTPATNKIAIAAGTLTITNSTVGNIEAGKDDETSGVIVTVGKSGTTDTSKVGSITQKTASSGKKTATPTLNLYDGAEVGDVDNISKKIYGGTVGGTGAKPDDLQGGLAKGYQIKNSSAGTYTYTTKFQDLIDKYEEYTDSNFEATLVGDTKSHEATVTFRVKEGADVTILTKLKVSIGVFIDLPSVVNKSPVSYWYKYDTTNGSEGLPVEKRYYVNEATIDLAAQVSDRTDHVVTGVKAEDDWSTTQTPITATLSGSVINLSGAVKTTGGAGKITLYFEIDGSYGAPGSEEKVTVGWDSATGTIQLAPVSTSKNVTLPTLRSNEVKVYDIVYTVTGTGLKSMVNHVEVDPTLSGNGTAGYIVVPNASAGMTGSYVELGKLMKAAFEGSDSNVSFANATDIKAALNAQVASLSDSSVTSYLNQARNTMATYDKKYEDKKNATANDYLSFDTLVLTPYLEISSSNPTITGNNQNTILTLTITLKARYTVKESVPGGQTAYKDDGKGNKVNWETTMALNAGDNGETVITLQMPTQTLVFTGSSYVHHDGQVYEAAWTSSKAVIKNLNGFTNKTFVINNTKPLAVVRTSSEMGGPIGAEPDFSVGIFFDNLQDAVDAVKNNGTVLVYDNYNGPINVTGEARKFTIKAEDPRDTVSITAVNGAHTTYEFKQSSNEYEIQLTGDTKSNATIRVTAVSNGTAAVNMTNAAGGSTITITTTASNGYRALTPTVTANNGASVSVTANSNGTYSFTVPNGATSVTVTPSFVPNNASSSNNNSLVPFTDVSTNAWYYDGVVYCYSNNGASGVPLMQGLSSTNFGASSLMTRAELVEVLWRIEGSPVESPITSFTDVQSGYWAHNSITWAANHGLVTGYGNNDFQPNRNISRQELAVILWRYAGQPNARMNLAATYPDGQGVATWAQSAMQWAASRGVLSGRSSVALNRLDAYAQAYRSELAVTIMKFHQAYIV